MLGLLLHFALLASTEAPAAGAPPIVVTESKDKREQVRCVKETPTGSMFATRTCKSVAEWERIEEEDQRTLRKLGRGKTKYGPN